MDCFLVQNGGGAPLNFKVVGNPQPSNPKENTIWVNTDVPIGKWYFDSNRPDDLQEGDVWFSVGTSSLVEFNALRKNGIQLYLLSAMQMIDGELYPHIAKIYQGGAWVDLWDGELYDAGNQYEYITGGWQSGGSGGTATIGTDSLSVSAPGPNKNASITTKNMIDLSRFNTLSVNVTSWSSGDNSNNRCQIRILDSTKQVIASANVSSIREYTVNVSSLDKGYIQLYAYASASEDYTHRMTVNKIGLK